MSNKYGWKPDLPDHRDLRMQLVSPELAESLPAQFDLSNHPAMPPIYDQGDLGSCTANAIAAAVEYLQRRTKAVWDFMPSRLFVYYNEREIEGTINSDAGAMIRDGVKSINDKGVCREDLWPYSIPLFTHQPTPLAYKNAQLHRALSYRRVPQVLPNIKATIASGLPIVFGFTVYASFESDAVATTGVMPMPQPNEEVLGGHAVLAVGYDDTKRLITVRNSWGPNWGVKGYFYMPYDYILNSDLADDLWAITHINSAPAFAS